MVSILVVALVLAVIQVAVFLHARNVIAASAAEGARYQANAGVAAGAGGPKAESRSPARRSAGRCPPG